MDFELPADLKAFLVKIDDFIESEIKPLNRRTTTSGFSTTAARTPGPTGTSAGSPNKEWEDLMREARRRADKAGIYRYSYPSGSAGWMAPT